MTEQIITDKGLVGWRGYQLARPHYLHSYDMVIQPLTQGEAHCESDHIAPEETCTCGFYSFKSREQLIEGGYGYQEIIAEVYVWGKVIEYTKGYRAQYTYPKKLYSNQNKMDSVIAYLADTYKVPYEILPRTADTSKEGDSTTKTLTFEDYWNAAFNPNVPVNVRRMTRQQIRQRVYMKLKNKETRQKNLEHEIVHVIKSRLELEKQMKLIDALKAELHKETT